MKFALLWSFLMVTIGLIGCKPAASKALLQPSEALGTVLARETARLTGPKKEVAVVSPDANWGPPSTAAAAFIAELKRQGCKALPTKAVNVGDPMRSGEIGWKATDLSEVLAKFPDAGAIVSFAGAPLLKPAEVSRIGAEHPPLVVVATGSLGNAPGIPGYRSQLAMLLDSKVIQLAVIEGGDPTAAPGQGDAAQQAFSQNYLILRPAN
jgi:hypothetical protein